MKIDIGGNSYTISDSDDGTELRHQVDDKLAELKQTWLDKNQAAHDALGRQQAYLDAHGDPLSYTDDESNELAQLQQATSAAETAADSACDASNNASLLWNQQVAKVVASLAEGSPMMKRALEAAAGSTHNFEGMDPMQVIAMVFAACKQMVSDKITAIGADMEQRNADTKALTSYLADVRNRRPESNDRFDSGDLKGKYKGFIPDNVVAELKKRGVTLPGADTDENGEYRVSQTDFDKVLSNIQDVIDGAGSKQQLVLNDLQKYNNLFQEDSDLVTNLFKSSKDVASNIIANMR